MADIQGQLIRLRDAANDFTGDTAEKIKDGAGKARESAGDTYADLREKGNRAATRANEIIQEHPIAAAAAAVAAGAVIAYLFPKSRAMMKALPGTVTALGGKAIEAAIAARTIAAENAVAAKDLAGETLTSARESVAKADLGAKASRLTDETVTKASRVADEAITLVAEKAEALSKALRARLPKG